MRNSSLGDDGHAGNRGKRGIREATRKRRLTGVLQTQWLFQFPGLQREMCALCHHAHSCEAFLPALCCAMVLLDLLLRQETLHAK